MRKRLAATVPGELMKTTTSCDVDRAVLRIGDTGTRKFAACLGKTALLVYGSGS